MINGENSMKSKNEIKILSNFKFSYVLMKEHDKPFNVKKELFTEYMDKNRSLLEIIKRERKILNEKKLSLKKNSKNIVITTNEKDRARKTFKGNNFYI